jgi:hypothetical protein
VVMGVDRNPEDTWRSRSPRPTSTHARSPGPSAGCSGPLPALPDERMKVQEGFFLGSAVPKTHKVPGVLGLNPIGDIPGEEKLQKLLRTERGKGRPVSLPFGAIVIPAVCM